MSKTIIDLDALKKFRQEYDKRLKNGTLIPSKSSVAKNLEPVSSASGSIQDTPFINQGTATNNNDSQAEVDTGTLGQHLEKRGNTACVNNYLRELNSTYWDFYNSNGSFSNGIATFTASSQGGYLYRKSSLNYINNHKYLCFVYVKTTSATTDIRLTFLNSPRKSTVSTTAWQMVYFLLTPTSSGNGYLTIEDNRSSDWDAIQVKDVACIDLTKWFNGNIPSDLLAHPESFAWYYNGDLSYNTGTLVNSDGRYIVNGGQNVWDEEWESGYYNNLGRPEPSSQHIRSKNYIQVIPNRTYYFRSANTVSLNFCEYDKDKNFIYFNQGNSNRYATLQPNTKYIRFNFGSAYGSTYQNDCTISLYYEGEDYTQYIPYEEPKMYDTGSEILRSAGSVKDIKLPDGTITRRVGSYTFIGNESLTSYQHTQDDGYYTFVFNVQGRAYNTNVLFAQFSKTNATNMGSMENNTYRGATNTNGVIFYSTSYQTESSMLSFLTGKTIYYELETPTTEQGTPFTENMDINDMGNMMWLDTNNALVDVPQGCKIFYPAWYVGFLDSLGQREDIDWAAEKVVSQEQLEAVDDKHDDLYDIVNENLGGMLRHQLVAESTGLDFANTDYVDLGSLSWEYQNTYSRFRATLSDIKPATSSSSFANILCSIYSSGTQDQSASSGYDKIVSIGTLTYVYIRDTSYTDATTFKNAMKGILLAYEKA